MLAVVRRRLARTLPLLVASLVVGIGTYFVGLSAIRGLESSQAEYGAETFAKYLVREVPDLHGVINGRVTSGESVDLLASIRPIGSVFKYSIYNEEGLLRVDSSAYAQSHLVGLRDSFQDAIARDVFQSGQLNFELRTGDGHYLPAAYSEVMVPLIADNRAVGVLSVLSDETDSLPRFMAQFRTLAGELVALVLVAFGVPVVLYVRKIRQLDRTRRRLRYTSNHDNLTGLLNRSGFHRALAEQLRLARQDHSAVAVHVIDLDRFKDVNESGGQTVGDAVLKTVGDRIAQLLGDRGRLARLGSDEFAVLQPHDPRASEVVGALAEEIAAALAKPFQLEARLLPTGGSIGYAYWPADAEDGEALVRAADVAMHHAKRWARGRAVAFNGAMEQERQQRHRVELRLRTALAEDELQLHYQPVFETSTRRLKGFEALVRMDDGAGTPISPAEFIPVAEEVGLIGELGLWVLRQACGTARLWPQELFVAVNLSPAQFGSNDLVRQVAEVLQWSGLEPRRLELEVTESLLIGDSDNILRELNEIKALGPNLALDDFGTGFSSLSYLWRFPFDKLKVDRSFMADLALPGSPSREILSTIIALGRVLHLEVTAEGVETEAQAAVLRELHCDLVQGYLYGRPQPSAEVAATILKSAASDIASASEEAGRRRVAAGFSEPRQVAPSNG